MTRKFRVLVLAGGIAALVGVAVVMSMRSAEAPVKTSGTCARAAAEPMSKPKSGSQPKTTETRSVRLAEKRGKLAARRIEDRMKAALERRERQIAEHRRRIKEEALPPELRYRNHPHRSKWRREVKELGRELHYLEMAGQRHPEQADVFKARREKVQAKLDEINRRRQGVDIQLNSKAIPVKKEEMNNE